MYSFFEEEDIDVIDEKGLMSFLEDWEKANPDWWANRKMVIRENKGEKKKLTFQNWNELKLISYWNPLEVAFLSCVAKYIEGYVHWNFEIDDESGNVRFEDGKCIIECGIMEYKDYSPKEIMGETIDKLNGKTKKLMICSNL